MHNLEELIIWKKAMNLTKEVYLILSRLPNDEKFGLSSQIKRSAVSIPSNIAEGAGRNSNKEFLHFLSISHGSSFELYSQLILTYELGMINKDKIKPILHLITEVQKINYSFQKKLKQII